MARFAKGAITHWRSTGVTALISTVLGYSVSNSYKHTTQLQSQPGPQLLTRSSVADAVESAGSSVVGVRVAPPGYSRLARSGGSGFVLSDGVVVTNSHVVEGVHGRNNLEVSLRDGRSYRADVIGTDRESDIAALRLRNAPNIPPLPVGSSSNMRVGDWVICIGNPLDLKQSATVGIISAHQRTGEELGLKGAGPFLQVDCAVNGGNSGGPIVNLDGEVIGVATMRAYGAEGVSFALPSDHAIRAARELVRRGKVSKPYIGAAVLELSPELVSYLRQRDPNFPPNVHNGLYVPRVHTSSPAEQSGLTSGDVIIRANGQDVSTATGFLEAVRSYIGASAPIDVIRGSSGKRERLQLRVEEG